MQKLGLVFGGGGGKGAFQIGVWQALRELCVESAITAVAGASAGALNGAMFASGDLEQAITAWQTITPGEVLTPAAIRDRGLRLPQWFPHIRAGWFSNTGLKRLIAEYVDFTKVAKGPPLTAVCTRLSTGVLPVLKLGMGRMAKALMTPEYFAVNGRPDAASVILASAAIPFVFPQVEIQGRRYCDGGVLDNLPIKPLYKAGCRKFIVVALEAHFHPDLQARYPGADFVVLDYDTHSALLNTVETLDFHPETAKRRMSAGYAQAMEAGPELRALAGIRAKISQAG